MEKDFIPGSFAVFLNLPANKKKGREKPYRSRMGNYFSLAEAKRAIKINNDAIGNTYGGLIEPLGDKPTYDIFKATGWEKVQ